MRSISSFLLKFKFQLITSAVVLVMAFGLYNHVENLNDELISERAKVVEISTKLRLQNDAVIQLKKDADLRIASHKKDLEAAKSQSAVIQGKAQIIYKTRPSTPDDSCRSALDLINGVQQ